MKNVFKFFASLFKRKEEKTEEEFTQVVQAEKQKTVNKKQEPTHKDQSDIISLGSQIDKAKKLHAEGNNTKAFEILNKNLENLENDADALLIMGIIYSQGQGIRKDEKKAVSFFIKSAELGHTIAMYNVGLAYLKGIGTEINYSKGIEWIKKAADRGDETSMMLLAGQYFGKGDYKKALNLYESLAKLENTEAMYELALMHLHGKGCPKNEKNAFEWFHKIININKPLTTISLEPTRKASFAIGLMYYNGANSVPKDYSKAIVFLKMAHKLGDENATSCLKQLGVSLFD